MDLSHRDVAMAIIRSAQWKNALRNTTKDVALDVETTPLRKLIRKMPGVCMHECICVWSLV